ncbi:MAG: type II secretion system protein GspK [Candidatus Hydrogenedentales bacterium]
MITPPRPNFSPLHPPARPARRRDDGVALVIAISFLLLFSMLGTAFVGYMIVEQESAQYETLQTRARTLAGGGVYAGVAEIRAALNAGATPQSEYTFNLPVYRQKSYGMEVTEHEVRVSVSDEAGRVNLNYAPRPTLEALGLSREAVRRLKSSLPRGADESEPGRTWLSSVGELVSRGILTQEEYAQLDKSVFTVFKGDSAQDAPRYVNVNSAPPAVLGAVFDLPPDKAEELAKQRPFESWEDAASKAGRDPAALAFSRDEADETNSPQALALNSRLFRIVSEAEVAPAGSWTRRIRSRVEAVVSFPAQGNYVFHQWRLASSEMDAPPDAAGVEARNPGAEPLNMDEPASPQADPTITDEPTSNVAGSEEVEP